MRLGAWELHIGRRRYSFFSSGPWRALLLCLPDFFIDSHVYLTTFEAYATTCSASVIRRAASIFTATPVQPHCRLIHDLISLKSVLHLVSTLKSRTYSPSTDTESRRPS